MRESVYQAKLITKIEALLPGCFIMKSDSQDNQGIPDLLILFNDRWAMLEVKISSRAAEQPNQAYFVDRFNEMSFASFINPDNEEEVLRDLQSTLGADWQARIS